MCTRYIAPEVGDIERHWQVGARDAPTWGREIFPRCVGPIIRALPASVAARDRADASTGRELLAASWSLVPWFAKTALLRFPTANARGEELSAKASYKQPWLRGQRCIIAALAFYEPNWESGRHVPWRFERSDGTPWGLAGLWNTWVDPASGAALETYTLLTLNADAHPLMRRMHRPDATRPPALQDKRSVVPIEPADVDTWLHAPLAQAAQLLRLAPVEVFAAAPEPAVPAAPAVSLPAQPSLW